MSEITDTWKSGPHQVSPVAGSATPISEDKRDPLVETLTEQAMHLTRVVRDQQVHIDLLKSWVQQRDERIVSLEEEVRHLRRIMVADEWVFEG